VSTRIASRSPSARPTRCGSVSTRTPSALLTS